MKHRQKKALTRANVLEWLQRRHWLRLHMFFIITATFLAGLTATKLLMIGGVDLLWLRYALAVCAAYLTFLIMIRLWIWHVCEGGDVDLSGDGIDVLARGATEVDWAGLGGGGEFGGAGASGAWDATTNVVTDVASSPAKIASSGSSDKSGCLSFDVGGDEGCVVVILLAILVGVLFIAGGYLIYAAPAILGEAAFEALLAAALARRAKKLAAAGWVGSVFRGTVWIFIAVLVISVALGWYAQKSCPDARRIRDAINCTRASQR